MTGKTHRVGGMLCVLGGYTLLESKGMLLSDVNPVLQLTVMYPFAIYGSIVSDLDHNWHSAPSKDIVSFIINKILHLTTGLRQKIESSGKKAPKILGVFDAKHRSWQTHSDLFLIAMIALLTYFISGNVTSADQVILKLVGTGFILGVISHLILDMLTPEGIWSVFTLIISGGGKSKKISKKLHLVPNVKFFATGGSWEKIVRTIMWVLCFVILVRIIYYIQPYRINFIFGN